MPPEEDFSQGETETQELGQETQETVVDQPEQQVQETSSEGHPAWESILSENNVPEAFKPMLRKTFQQWDEGVQAKFQEHQQVQSQFEPYKPFLENNIDPAQLERAYQVMHLIENDPRRFYDQMGQYYKYAQQQQQAPSGQGQQDEFSDEYDLSGEEVDPYKDKFEQIQQNQELIAKALYTQYQKEQEAQEDAELDKEVARLRSEKGDFDEQFVYNVAGANGGDLEAAVDKYFEIVAQVQGQQRPGANFPRVVSPSGGIPQTTINPADLSDEDSKKFAMQILSQLNPKE